MCFLYNTKCTIVLNSPFISCNLEVAVPYTVEIGNYEIASCLLNKCVGDLLNLERYGWTRQRFYMMSTEFAIHPALWDATYVGRQYVPDKP